MAALQKFKLLATQCAAPAASPSRSPGPGPAAAPGSPAFRLRRRRRTLRTLLRRGSDRRTPPSPGKPPLAPDCPPPLAPDCPPLLSNSLADLFVASPPLPVGSDESGGSGRRFGLEVVAAGVRRGGGGGGEGEGVGPRFASRSLRHRLLRRAWRPVLVAIPE